MAGTKTKTKAKVKKTAAKPKRRLSSLGGSSDTKAKSDIPVVTVTNQDNLKAMQGIVDAKKKESEANGILKVAQQNLRQSAINMFETQCLQDGTLHTSIRMNGKYKNEEGVVTNPSVMFTHPKSCNKMIEDKTVDSLREIFSEEFDNLFGFNRVLKINADDFSEDQIDEAIVALEEILGDDLFKKSVKSECLVEPKDAFYGQRILNPEIRKLAQRAFAEGYAVTNKSSFRL